LNLVLFGGTLMCSKKKTIPQCVDVSFFFFNCFGFFDCRFFWFFCPGFGFLSTLFVIRGCLISLGFHSAREALLLFFSFDFNKFIGVLEMLGDNFWL